VFGRVEANIAEEGMNGGETHIAAAGDGGEFDAQLGVPGLHTVTGKVEFRERPTILPPELQRRFSGRNFWRRPRANTRNVAVVLPSQLRSPGFAQEASLDVLPLGGNLEQTPIKLYHSRRRRSNLCIRQI
jgi:hypothetical protein